MNKKTAINPGPNQEQKANIFLVRTIGRDAMSRHHSKISFLAYSNEEFIPFLVHFIFFIIIFFFSFSLIEYLWNHSCENWKCDGNIIIFHCEDITPFIFIYKTEHEVKEEDCSHKGDITERKGYGFYSKIQMTLRSRLVLSNWFSVRKRWFLYVFAY